MPLWKTFLQHNTLTPVKVESVFALAWLQCCFFLFACLANEETTLPERRWTGFVREFNCAVPGRPLSPGKTTLAHQQWLCVVQQSCFPAKSIIAAKISTVGSGRIPLIETDLCNGMFVEIRKQTSGLPQVANNEGRLPYTMDCLFVQGHFSPCLSGLKALENKQAIHGIRYFSNAN